MDDINPVVYKMIASNHPVAVMAMGIVNREGGFNITAGDYGGATNHGVSLRYAKGIGLDLDGDGDVDADDIRLVTPDLAIALYIDDFYLEPRVQLLPACLHEQIFDLGVNAGPARAIMLAQKIANGLVGAGLVTDGSVGPKTRRALENAVERYGDTAVGNAYVDSRMAFYEAIVIRDPSQRKFLNGWRNRANHFRK